MTLLHEQRWAALQARDKAFDGQFFYSVRTTGVYCRPACSARLPHRKNVEFYDTPAQAEAAGFRPCQRCRPDQPPLAQRHAALIIRICRLLQDALQAPSLAELAREAGLSVYHFHRLFKSITGVSPKAYASHLRTQRMRNELERGTAVTQAIYEAGFGSSSGFYSQPLLGMEVSSFRSGGAGSAIRYAFSQCWMGRVLVAATDRGICAILIGEGLESLVKELGLRFPRAELVEADADFAEVVGRVVAILEEPAQAAELPLDIQGTAFQQRVWKELQKIPAGTTASYAEIAHQIGSPRAARAVAGACAANPIAVAIPCHRVVRQDGGLSGYRWGKESKKELLRREGALSEK